MSTQSFTAAMVALAAVALLGFGLIAKENDPLEVGSPLPDRAFAALDADGESGERALADYRGRYVLVNLWASWCGPCRTESPDLQEFYERHRKQGFVVYGINTEDTLGDAVEFIAEYGLSYPISRDSDREVRDLYGSTAFPESFLVDRRGRLLLEIRGPVTLEYLERAITPILRGRVDPLAPEARGT